MTIINVTDHLGNEWELLMPMRFVRTRNGHITMWALVGKGPPCLSMYGEIPLPVFTEWWE